MVFILLTPLIGITKTNTVVSKICKCNPIILLHYNCKIKKLFYKFFKYFKREFYFFGCSLNLIFTYSCDEFTKLSIECDSLKN